jgi:hypothetical protein
MAVVAVVSREQQEIGDLVYDLYGITAEERKIEEGKR